MAQIQLFPGAISPTVNLGSTAIDSVQQGDGNSAANSLALVFDVTVLTGTNILLSLLLFDPVSGKKVLYNSPAFAAITAVGTYVYLFGPPGVQTTVTGSGITAIINMPVPSLWAVRLAPTAITSITATLTAYTVPLLN